MGRPDAVGFSGGAAGVGRRGVGERTDRRGPCVSEGRERRRRGRNDGPANEVGRRNGLGWLGSFL
jgi:hypothetical protein